MKIIKHIYALDATLKGIASLRLEGNIVPHAWYKHVVFETGKPDLLGIIILSEVLYWYRPTVVKHETTGEVIGYRKKFKADKLQRSIASFAKQFGTSHRQVSDALGRLERMGLIERELRTIESAHGRIGNVLYISPEVSAIAGISSLKGQSLIVDDSLPEESSSENNQEEIVSTPKEQEHVTPLRNQLHKGSPHEDLPLCNQLHKVPRLITQAPTFDCTTYTENTTRDYTETTATAARTISEIMNTQGILSAYAAAAAVKENISEEPTHAQTHSKASTSPQVERFAGLVAEVLTEDQKRRIANRIDALSESMQIENKDTLTQEIEEGILDPACFRLCGQNFPRKLQAILNSIQQGDWTPSTVKLEAAHAKRKSEQEEAQTAVLLARKEQEDALNALKREYEMASRDIPHFQNMLAVLEKNNASDVEKDSYRKAIEDCIQKAHKLLSEIKNFKTTGDFHATEQP